MIEFAPRSENKITYHEAILYCQFCDHNGHRNWRLPTWDEYIENCKHEQRKHPAESIYGWYDDRDDMGDILYVYPVRDI